MTNSNLDKLKISLRGFAEARDWDQFHSPKNLSMALSAEASELLEHTAEQGCSNVASAWMHRSDQWLTEDQSRNLPKDKRDEVGTEIADLFIYLLRLSDKLGIDILEATDKKMIQNAIKYPADKVRGSSRKYTEYE